MIINMASLHDHGYVKTEISGDVFHSNTLNDFISCGKETCAAVRKELITLFSDENSSLAKDKSDQESILIPADSVTMLMPIEVGDYTDFYSSIEHATNVGKMFRDPENALLPNWRHLPVGYHGRASSIVVSGTPVHRPKGQQKPADSPPV